jgi:prephenate dehydrogenase
VTRQRLGILGLGLIGGSLARKHHAVGAWELYGFDQDAIACEVAKEWTDITITESAGELGRICDLVVCALPPDQTAEGCVALLAAGDATVADVCSVKQPIVDRVDQLTRGARAADLARFFPTHPLAGSDGRGFEAAVPDLFWKAPWAVCDTDWNVESRERRAELLRMIVLSGGKPVFCEPAEHDAAVARSSHLVQLAASALAAVAAVGELERKLSGPGLRDTTRLAGSPPDLWAEIWTSNGPESAAALDTLIGQLESFRSALTGGDREALRALVADGNEQRAALLDQRWPDASKT